MGAKHSVVPSVFSLQYVLLLFIEKHLHEGGTAGGWGENKEAFLHHPLW